MENIYMSKTPIELTLKLCGKEIKNYIFHTKIYLEYDEDDAFIFILKDDVIFTYLFDEESNIDEKLILYIVSFEKVYSFNIDILFFFIRKFRRKELYHYTFL